jgi:DNA-binding HxlR family transcriptional regulator
MSPRANVHGYLSFPLLASVLPFPRNTWTELFEKTKACGISRSTLSRYLKRYIEQGRVVQDVNQETYPVTVLYRLNQPPEISKLLKLRETLEKIHRAVILMPEPRS